MKAADDGAKVGNKHHNLESIETACFGHLDFAAEPLNKVLVDDAIRCGKEGEDVFDEVFLVRVQFVVPVVHVFGEINLFGGPEGCLGAFVGCPNL